MQIKGRRMKSDPRRVWSFETLLSKWETNQSTTSLRSKETLAECLLKKTLKTVTYRVRTCWGILGRMEMSHSTRACTAFEIERRLHSAEAHLDSFTKSNPKRPQSVLKTRRRGRLSPRGRGSSLWHVKDAAAVRRSFEARREEERELLGTEQGGSSHHPSVHPSIIHSIHPSKLQSICSNIRWDRRAKGGEKQEMK